MKPGLNQQIQQNQIVGTCFASSWVSPDRNNLHQASVSLSSTRDKYSTLVARKLKCCLGRRVEQAIYATSCFFSGTWSSGSLRRILHKTKDMLNKSTREYKNTKLQVLHYAFLPNPESFGTGMLLLGAFPWSQPYANAQVLGTSRCL